MSAESMAGANANEVDLDAFLTSVESKLRGPFSSLDLAKAIQTSQVRDHVSASEYLQNLAQVIERTDKTTQLRTLIGLLGLEESLEADEEIRSLLEQAVEAPTFEEWVRVVSGLVQGILFQDAEGKPQRGHEASVMLEKTCKDILKQVKKVLDETDRYEADDEDEDDDENHASHLTTADTDPTFCPYRYGLLAPERLEALLPEASSHAHFGVDTAAEILQQDAQQERQRALESKEHDQSAVTNVAAAPTKKTTPGGAATPSFPGFRSSKPTATAASKQRPKPSMFLTRKPANLATKTVLHTRKAGAAQNLVAKGRRRGLASAAAAPSHPNKLVAARMGRAQAKLSSQQGKSRMIMLDEKESNGIIKEQQDAAAAVGGDKKKVGLKRKADTQQQEQQTKMARPKPAPVAAAQEPAAEAPAPTPPVKTKASSLASAALTAYRAQVGVEAPAANAAAPPNNAATTKQQDWRELLKERSNKLSEDDRFRIKQFFVDRFNPTPEEPVVRLKLHEERTTDAQTGEPVKETFYLELNYKDFTSRQSRKIKRY